MDTAGGSGSVSFWGSVWPWAKAGCALAMPRPWGHLLVWDSTAAFCQPPSPQNRPRRSPGAAGGPAPGFSHLIISFKKARIGVWNTARDTLVLDVTGLVSGHMWAPPDVCRDAALVERLAHEGWQGKAAAVGLGSAISFSEGKREAENNKANATVVQGVPS